MGAKRKRIPGKRAQQDMGNSITAEMNSVIVMGRLSMHCEEVMRSDRDDD